MSKPLTEVYVCPVCITVGTTPSRCRYMCDRDHGTERVRFVAVAKIDATLAHMDYLERKVAAADRLHAAAKAVADDDDAIYLKILNMALSAYNAVTDDDTVPGMEP